MISVCSKIDQIVYPKPLETCCLDSLDRINLRVAFGEFMQVQFFVDEEILYKSAVEVAIK
jgi:hypothetical protein